MVNYKRVICEVAVLAAVLAVVSAAPAPEEHYDQRQNGTENIRVSIDGIVIAVAPAEAFVEAAADFAGLIDVSTLEEYLKPPPALSSPQNKPGAISNSHSKPDLNKPVESSLSDVSLPSETKPQTKDASAAKEEKVKRMKHRLANVLIPLLRRTRHQ